MKFCYAEHHLKRMWTKARASRFSGRFLDLFVINL